jgi:hypothetical protein
MAIIFEHESLENEGKATPEACIQNSNLAVKIMVEFVAKNVKIALAYPKLVYKTVIWL